MKTMVFSHLSNQLQTHLLPSPQGKVQSTGFWGWELTMAVPSVLSLQGWAPYGILGMESKRNLTCNLPRL